MHCRQIVRDANLTTIH